MKTRILVVEDDPAIILGLADLLEDEGFAVEQAVDG
jgi:CheY-like chemotaxis protein